MEILQRLNREQGLTVVMVTHDPVIAHHTRRILHLYDGRIAREEIVDEPRIARPEAEPEPEMAEVAGGVA
jgi:putative ABC transport system ATP-binding protein